MIGKSTTNVMIKKQQNKKEKKKGKCMKKESLETSWLVKPLIDVGSYLLCCRDMHIHQHW